MPTSLKIAITSFILMILLMGAEKKTITPSTTSQALGGVLNIVFLSSFLYWVWTT